MMPNAVNFEGVFETLSEPIAVCDEDGNILALNKHAREYLGGSSLEGLKIDLQQRETVRQIRLAHPSSLEFFLADVQVHGSRRTRVSASFCPMDNGQYRVLFASGPEGKVLPPNIRIMESLVNVGRHVELFKTEDKTVALFAASFVDIFPMYSFRIELMGASDYLHTGWPDATATGAGGKAEGHQAPESFVFSGAHRGWRQPIGERGALQVERADDTKFSVSERQAFETFAQQLNLAIARFGPGEQGSSDSMMVGPIIDQLDAIVVVCDARRRVLVSNRTFETMVGSADVVGADILEFFGPEEQARIRTVAAGVMASGEPQSIDAHLRTTTDGQVALRVQLAPARGEGDQPTGFVLTGQQSELSLMELEERMTRAEQLMNLGELATGVAHELKNPLTSILNYAEYLLVKYQAPTAAPNVAVFDERDSERLQRIIDGVERIDAFVKDLMVLARPNEGEAALVNLHSVLHESAMMCEVALQQSRATLQLELGEGEPIVPGFRNQLKQVFVNLVANAAKSMGDGGGRVLVRTEIGDRTVICHVSDDGVGMSPKTLERIFEPFFTTRKTRGGSGLGLALVQTIVQRHEGDITVESVVDRGTTFTIRLPLASQ